MAAWPLVFQANDDGARHLVMPAMTQKLGIIFAPAEGKRVETQSRHQQATEELIDKLGDFDTFSQNFHERYTDWLPFYWRGFSQTTRYTYVLDDISNVDALWNAMRSHHRQVIRRAEKAGITISDSMDIDAFLALNRKTFERQGLSPPAPDETIRRIDAACASNGGRKIFAGLDSTGRVHAAVYVAWVDGTAYYLMGGSEPAWRDSGAQFLAMWHAIQFCGSVASRFDFEGSMLPQVERVFRGFGAVQHPYFTISRFPPGPSSLKGYLAEAIRFRVKSARRRITG